MPSRHFGQKSFRLLDKGLHGPNNNTDTSWGNARWVDTPGQSQPGNVIRKPPTGKVPPPERVAQYCVPTTHGMPFPPTPCLTLVSPTPHLTRLGNSATAHPRTPRAMATAAKQPSPTSTAAVILYASAAGGEGARTRSNRAVVNRNYPFTLKALGLFTLTGVVLLYYFQNEKERVKKKREEQNAQTTRSIGKPRIGGPFELVDSRDGKTVTDKDFLGRYTLVYFGFTHCPDICPEELDKMSEVVNLMSRSSLVCLIGR
ncbi:hypothetical protein BC936DRAFT_141668, partial [Jimgerdemannia flammicorona]